MLLDRVPGAFVLAGVVARAEVWVHEYPDGACAVFLGPHRLADDDDAREPSRVPTAPKPGAVLGAVKDKPFGRACARP